MPRPSPTKDSTLREIILYILEERGDIGDDDNSMRRAAQMLEEGSKPTAKLFAANFLMGKRPNTTREEIQKSRWMFNLRKASYARLVQCKDLIEGQLKLMGQSKEDQKFKLPENFAETVLVMIGGASNIKSVAATMGLSTNELSEYALRGKVPVTKDHIDRFIQNLEAAISEENTFLSPLLRAYAEKNMTVSQAKALKKVDKELFRKVAREIVIDMRNHFGLDQAALEQRVKDAYEGKLKTDERLPQRISVARVAFDKVASFENGDKMSDSVFASCIRSYSAVMFLERNNPKQHKLLGFLAAAIGPK